LPPKAPWTERELLSTGEATAAVLIAETAMTIASAMVFMMMSPVGVLRRFSDCESSALGVSEIQFATTLRNVTRDKPTASAPTDVHGAMRTAKPAKI
jgi:hypothetical protein